MSQVLGIRETAVGIKLIKDFFERQLAEKLNLTRVSAPLFVLPETGLNDNLSGVERPVSFEVKALHKNAEIVHSLAKWKRLALSRYGFSYGEGLYTDMNAIRRDEDMDELHSIYVDQWDWERVLSKDERNEAYLKATIKGIYDVFLETQNEVRKHYPALEAFLPPEIFFITSDELLELYPDLSSKERERAICRDKKAVFVMKIGDKLKNGEPHDGRAPDYDDWQLNGDILFWYPPLEREFEVSSMGIRVDKKSLQTQLEIAGCTERTELPFHKAILENKLPLTVGGGIGQSRICMFFLNKTHIGEVQASLWSDDILRQSEAKGINLL